MLKVSDYPKSGSIKYFAMTIEQQTTVW